MQLSHVLGLFLLFQLPLLWFQPVDRAVQLIDVFLAGQEKILDNLVAITFKLESH